MAHHEVRPKIRQLITQQRPKKTHLKGQRKSVRGRRQVVGSDPKSLSTDPLEQVTYGLHLVKRSIIREESQMTEYPRMQGVHKCLSDEIHHGKDANLTWFFLEAQLSEPERPMPRHLVRE